MERTNVQMIRSLNEKYSPSKRGFISIDEIYTINSELELDSRDVLSLRNLRDTVVLFMNVMADSFENDVIKMLEINDKISAITAVIDNKIFNIGGEV